MTGYHDWTKCPKHGEEIFVWYAGDRAWLDGVYRVDRGFATVYLPEVDETISVRDDRQMFPYWTPTLRTVAPHDAHQGKGKVTP